MKHVKSTKRNVVLWPHRYNKDKQPEIFEDLVPVIKGNCVITQKLDLSKEQYYATMGEAAVVFSCALHENLGISVMEGVLAGAVPIVPDRASYKEMYLDEFKYPSHWTESFQAYKSHKEELVDHINNVLANVDEFDEALDEQRKILIRDYLHADVMFHHLLNNKLDKTGQTYYHIPMSVSA